MHTNALVVKEVVLAMVIKSGEPIAWLAKLGAAALWGLAANIELCVLDSSIATLEGTLSCTDA